MTKNKKKLFQFGVGALLSVSLIFGVIIHEILDTIRLISVEKAVYIFGIIQRT
jgi:hypothetical protein